jgi:hypothetical protein
MNTHQAIIHELTQQLQQEYNGHPTTKLHTRPTTTPESKTWIWTHGRTKIITTHASIHNGQLILQWDGGTGSDTTCTTKYELANPNFQKQLHHHIQQAIYKGPRNWKLHIEQ